MPATRASHRDPLERARLHAGLAGFGESEARRLAASAQREAEPAIDPARFWRALYRAIASSSRRPAAGKNPIADALVALPIEARTAFLLRVGDSLSPDRIATALDEPEPRARRHLAAATAALREGLGGGRPDEAWIDDVRRWLDAGPFHRTVADPAAQAAGAVAAGAPGATGSRRPASWRWWLALAVGLAGYGALRLHIEGDPAEAAREAPVPMPPHAILLGLPEEDHALIVDDVDLDTLARLDFLIWDSAADAR